MYVGSGEARQDTYKGLLTKRVAIGRRYLYPELTTHAMEYHMIPIDTNEASRAYNDKKIRLKDLLFLQQVQTQDDITQNQYQYITDLAERSLPYQIIKTQTYRAPRDAYYQDQYYKVDY